VSRFLHALAIGVLLAVVAPAVPAQAHPAGVQVAVDTLTRVTALTPALPGVHVRYVDDGSRLELRNDSARTVEIAGYEDEPMYQVRPDGVWKNTKAPSLYVDNLGNLLPSGADAHAAPEWRHVSAIPVARWQDHRALWHGVFPPAVRDDPTVSHRLADWQVPVRDGSTSARIAGTLDWVPPPDPSTWWTLVVVVAAAVAGLGWVGRPAARYGLAAGAFAVGLAAMAYPLLIVVKNVEPRAGSIALALLSQALPVLIGLALLAAGGALLAKRTVGDFVMAFSGACAVFLVGAGEIGVFSHAVAPIPADGRWARYAVVAVVGGGTGLAIAGVARLRRAVGAVGSGGRAHPVAAAE
jgi:hypothetical protein